MFKPIEFPGFLCKARFPPGGEFFIHLKWPRPPYSQTILNKRKSSERSYILCHFQLEILQILAQCESKLLNVHW